jgi:sterol desaturase/sphingolipid hydroxylase (fatty acid hydroxylase superfamily)/rhodanese-related sulfurtransferase
MLRESAARWVTGTGLTGAGLLLIWGGWTSSPPTLEVVLAEVRERYPEVRSIPAQQLEEWIGGPSNAHPQILDARTTEEFRVSHLPGARQIPPGIRTRDLIASLDTNRAVVVYCSVGLRAALEARLLMQGGWTNVFTLEGSIFQWANEGRALARRDGPGREVHPYNARYGLMLRPELRASLPRGSGLFQFEIPLWQQLRFTSALGLMILLVSWESLVPFAQYFRSNLRGRAFHALGNYAAGALNTLMIALAFAPTWWWVANWAEAHRFGLLHLLDLRQPLRGLLALLLLDAWTYSWHRLNHAVPLLWRFHRAHHSDLHVDVSSTTRFHPGEILASSLMRIPVLLLGGIQFGELLFFETAMFGAVQLQHSNIALPKRLDRILQWLLVTPAMHRVHHSPVRTETDSNFSSLLSIWDRVFGTWRFLPDR